LTSKRSLKIEVTLVLLLSLGASAIYSVLDLIQAAVSPSGIGGTTSNLNPQQSAQELFDFLYRFTSLSLALAPVALALFLLSKSDGRPFQLIGLWPGLGKDFLRGGLLFVGIGVPGIALYLGARALGFAARVVPGSFDYWWMIPLLLFSALRAALQEDVIMIGYLYKRFDELGLRFRNQQLISAAIRAAYHAYQGIGGILGNFLMGLIFGWAYRRWGRVLPLVFAHFLLDAFSFVGYALLAKQLATISGLF
jgi:membrane protease YdiL (CAAX protease family)